MCCIVNIFGYTVKILFFGVARDIILKIGYRNLNLILAFVINILRVISFWENIHRYNIMTAYNFPDELFIENCKHLILP